MGKLSLKELQEYVDGRLSTLHDKVDYIHDRVDSCYKDMNLQQVKYETLIEQDEDDFSDLRLRAEAVKEATIKVKAIYPVEVAVDGVFVDEVLKVAAFLLGEPNSNSPVNNYIDQYHYHYSGAGTYVPYDASETTHQYGYDPAGYVVPNPDVYPGL